MGFVCFYAEDQVKTDTTELRLLLKRCTSYLCFTKLWMKLLQFLFFIYSLEDLCYVAERSKCIDTDSIWFIIYLKDSTSLIFDISFKGLINGIKLFCERVLLDFLPLKKDNCNSRTSAHSLFLQKIVLYRVLSRLASSGFLTLIISVRENINVFTEMHNRTLNYVISLSTSTAPGIS